MTRALNERVWFTIKARPFYVISMALVTHIRYFFVGVIFFAAFFFRLKILVEFMCECTNHYLSLLLPLLYT